MTFRIEAIEWGNGSSPLSIFRVWKGSDPRWVEFHGDAYWQWGAVPERANGTGFCWAQALHDALEGWHATVLHQDEVLSVLPFHPDYEAIENLWDAAQA